MKPSRKNMIKEKAAAIAGALLGGGVVVLAWYDDHLGRVLWRIFNPVLLPVNFLVQSIIGTSDAYLFVYVALDVIFMAILGFIVGHYLYKAFRFLRHRKEDEAA